MGFRFISVPLTRVVDIVLTIRPSEMLAYVANWSAARPKEHRSACQSLDNESPALTADYRPAAIPELNQRTFATKL